MAVIPEPERTTRSEVYAAIEAAQKDERREYMGPSSWHPCVRRMWYAFAWAWPEPVKHSARMLRIFRRGHNAEPEIIADLKAAGLNVHSEQLELSMPGAVASPLRLYRGHIDGIVEGLPESSQPHLLEMKTMASKYWRQLAEKGVEQAKPEHYAQMQLYMSWSGLRRALYVAENKDTQELHFERVRYNAGDAERFERDIMIAAMALEAPIRINEDPAFYICKMCDFRPVCHKGALPMVSCRTCCHACPNETSGATECSLHDIREIPQENAITGCATHTYHPDLFPGEKIEMDELANWIEYELPGGARVRNGTAGPVVLSSPECKAAHDAGLLGNKTITAIRERFGGTITP